MMNVLVMKQIDECAMMMMFLASAPDARQDTATRLALCCWQSTSDLTPNSSN